MGIYAIIVTSFAFLAALYAVYQSREHVFPAIAVLMSIGIARFAEWGPYQATEVMKYGMLLCAFVALFGYGRIAKAIGTIYVMRMLLFVNFFPAVYTASSMWELSNALVILQALILLTGAYNGGRVVDGSHSLGTDRPRDGSIAGSQGELARLARGNGARHRNRENATQTAALMR